MTDAEIVKALECCSGDAEEKYCFSCPLYAIDDCQNELNLSALDLINRQKAEIEKRDKSFIELIEVARLWEKKYENARVKAIKEFAERLKTTNGTMDKRIVSVERIDNLVREMVDDIK